MTRSALAAFAFICTAGTSLPVYPQVTEPQGWLGTETLKTRFGDFQFKDGYPGWRRAQRLLDLQKLNRAVEVYTTQLMPVSEIGLREGLRAFGARTPQQVVIWEQLMDARDGAAHGQHRDGLCARAISI